MIEDDRPDPTFDAVAEVVKSSIRSLRAAVSDVEAGRKGAVKSAVSDAKTLAQAVARLDKMMQARPKVKEKGRKVAEEAIGEAGQLTAVATLLDRMKRLSDSSQAICRKCGGVL